MDEKVIFGNPIYERHKGSYESINQTFDGDFNQVISDLTNTLVGRTNK